MQTPVDSEEHLYRGTAYIPINVPPFYFLIFDSRKTSRSFVSFSDSVA